MTLLSPGEAVVSVPIPTIGAVLAAFAEHGPARALQAAHDGAHGTDAHSMTAMLWSMLVLVAAAGGLIVIGALWHRRSQVEPSGDRPTDRC